MCVRNKKLDKIMSFDIKFSIIMKGFQIILLNDGVTHYVSNLQLIFKKLQNHCNEKSIFFLLKIKRVC